MDKRLPESFEIATLENRLVCTVPASGWPPSTLHFGFLVQREGGWLLRPVNTEYPDASFDPATQHILAVAEAVYGRVS